MKLLHLSDLHLRSAPDALQNVRFRACIDRLMAEHADADLCLITGDLAEDPSEATYQFLQDEVSRLPFQTHLLLGTMTAGTQPSQLCRGLHVVRTASRNL
jgi:3',5'-cyclic AMP phosphodiesterase CpdA